MQQIDLSKYAGPDVILLSGRPMGEEIRRKLQVDNMDSCNDLVQVKVPQSIVSLNSSFFLGLFAPSIQTLGESRFRAKYVFECRSVVLKDIDSGIRQALNIANPLISKKQ
jgi:hypothetical protein